MAAIDPPVPAPVRPSDPADDDSVRFRSDFAHFLRSACTSTQRTMDALEAMGKYLSNAKVHLEEHGKAQVLLDQNIIMNYVACEDRLISCASHRLTSDPCHSLSKRRNRAHCRLKLCWQAEMQGADVSASYNRRQPPSPQRRGSSFHSNWLYIALLPLTDPMYPKQVGKGTLCAHVGTAGNPQTPGL
jgi:hypothetical protein